MTRADLAVMYAKREWFPFPLRVSEKRPATVNGFYAATNDLVRIRELWRQKDWNIGIFTGKANLVVIDLDIDKDDPSSWARGGPTPGISWWLEACDKYGYDWEQTYCVATASGGMHVYFSSDEPYPPAVGKFGALVDIRAGLSYVVAAGSETDVGIFEHFGGDDAMPLPEWLAALIEPIPVKYVTPREQMNYDRREGAYQNAVDGLLRKIREAPDGERNNMVNWCAWKIGQHWWTEDQREDALDLVVSTAKALGIDDDKRGQTEATIRSQRNKWPAR
jgi:hypothetical protein